MLLLVYRQRMSDRNDRPIVDLQGALQGVASVTIALLGCIALDVSCQAILRTVGARASAKGRDRAHRTSISSAVRLRL